MKQACHSCQVIAVDVNETTVQPFVIDAFILAVLAEAAPVSMLVLGRAKRHGRAEGLHHFLEIFLCLHTVIV